MPANTSDATATSADSRSHRPVKKARRLGPGGDQASAIEALFDKQPDIHIPTSSTKAPKTTADLAAPPEIVTNVQGSSAGAGSGEFHVYKASRRREYERIRLMEEEAKREEDTAAWEERQRLAKEKTEGKTSKNRKRREKKKANLEKAKHASGDEDGGSNTKESVMKKVKPLQVARPDDGPDETAASMAESEAKDDGETNGIVMHDED